jgi:hypothetical protein
VNVTLTKGYTATVSRRDYKRVSALNWFAQENKRSDGSIRNVYAACHRGKPRKTVYMHRFILGVTDTHVLVDHKDGNGLNCVRRNMRCANKSQNTVNSRPHFDNASGVLGVSFDKRYKCWTVRIAKKFYGCFHTLAQAKRVASNARRKEYGRFNRNSHA